MRKPAVAGSWYAGSADSLRRQIEGCFLHPLGPGALPGEPGEKERNIMGLVSPHAGYAFSGPVAAHGFLQLAKECKPETIVILGPNHTGLGAYVAVSAEDTWRTPLGDVELDNEVGEAIVAASRWAEWDDLAHKNEHSIELQLPFLQYTYGFGFKVVLVAMMRQNLDVSQELGGAIARALRDKNGIIIASSDFTHHEPHDSASKKDHLALEAIIDLHPERLAEVVDNYRISTCGPGPVIAMLTACRQLGAKTARLLRYADSGDITGDYHRVVGYASVSVSA
ncbi:AmmeMemoRadiSam system protein B [Chloroflexota bacterium]